MQSKWVIIPMACVFVLLFGVSLTEAQHMDGADLKTHYSISIDDIIKKCQRKADRIHSKCSSIRRTAEVSAAKIEYLQRHRDRLIDDMIKKNIGRKTYKISHFLNEQFFIQKRNTVRSDSL